MSEEFTCIIFCPACCTNQDARGEGEQEFECLNCGTQFSVVIDAKIFVQHSMF